MSRISETFKELSARHESALILYITAGYPDLESTITNIKILARYGDMLEIGIPFSDPIADGRTIQYASHIALQNGARLSGILKMLGSIKIDKPMIIMSYLNPLISFGIEDFFKTIKKIGISGLIIPDLVVEESELLMDIAKRYSIDLIQLIAPTSDDERIKLIGKYSSGFVYCISITGTTGARKRLPEGVLSFVKRVKLLINKPVAVGFGISSCAQIKRLSQIADGVVIGSRIIEAIKNGEEIECLIRRFKKATIF